MTKPSPLSGGPRQGDRAIDRHLEVYDVRSYHSTEIAASVTETYRAARDVDLGKSPFVVALVAVRGLPHFLTGKVRPSRSLTLETFLKAGFVMLEENAPRELVMGAVGKFWRPDSGFVTLSADDFPSFDEPGYAKAVVGLTVEEHGRGSLFATETRVACTDASALRKFSLYWRVIGPFSGLIRQIMLDQVKRTAEGTRPKLA